MQEIWQMVESALGLGAESLNALQMALRALIVYVAALAMVRLGEKRFLGKHTAFDMILAIVLGSVVSRAVTGQSPFFPTLAVGFVLVGIHWAFARLAFRSDRFGTLVKGRARVLVEDGEIRWEAMKKSNLSRQDLLESLRTQMQIEDPAKVQIARLERSGEISALPREGEPQVVEVTVEEGVQTVRVEWHTK